MRPYSADEYTADEHGADGLLADAPTRTVLRVVKSGIATSRTDIASTCGLSASTVAQRVGRLMDAGYVREAGEGQSRGGRRPRTIEINPDRGVVCGVEFGARHATIGMFDFSGRLLDHCSHPIDISDGPKHIADWTNQYARGWCQAHGGEERLLGLAAALPGPVDQDRRRMTSPSRMHGWNDVDAEAAFASASSVPVVVDNDANLAALGEAHYREMPAEPTVYVKIGSSIGCGIIINGRLYRGHHGVAGDISHVTVPGEEKALCSCGRTGCLDALAGGRALAQKLREQGVDVADSAAMVELAQNGHPLATQVVREAGARVGSVLASIVNFFNPSFLVLGGILGESDACIAGIRSVIYTECLPMMTHGLTIDASRAKQTAGMRGAAAAILNRLTGARN